MSKRAMAKLFKGFRVYKKRYYTDDSYDEPILRIIYQLADINGTKIVYDIIHPTRNRDRYNKHIYELFDVLEALPKDY